MPQTLRTTSLKLSSRNNFSRYNLLQVVEFHILDLALGFDRLWLRADS